MDHKLEVSPSGRAKCRGCKESIPKGEVRFCESFESAFSGGEAYRYWHLLCAARSRIAGQLKATMDASDVAVPNKAEVEAEIANAAKKGGKGAKAFPHADVAPTGRARCMICDEALEKGKVRVAVERETETPTGMTVRGAGYLHPGCALEWAEENEWDAEEFMDKVFANSTLDDAQRDELTAGFERE